MKSEPIKILMVDDTAENLVALGGSAGGLLIGAVANMAPQLFAGFLAQVPFVDPLTTILDPSLPLTVTEWDEWGNPLADSDVYYYMKSYSPYENVSAKDYPPILAMTSLNDTRVYYVEPAKWVAALRHSQVDPVNDAAKVAQLGGEGVGLLRSEFLFMERRDAPTEDEQFETYRSIVQAVGSDHPIIIRTLDVGGDKPLSYLPIPKEDNPFLGEFYKEKPGSALRAQMYFLFERQKRLREALAAESPAPLLSDFLVEKDRIFVSSLSANRYYEDILDYLAKHRYATRDTLYKALHRTRSKYAGGSFSAVLQELVDVGFIERYAPVTVKNPRTSRIARYGIADEYLHFYYRFIEPKLAAIDAGKFVKNPAAAVNPQDFSKLMGFSFERWCRRNEALIAEKMKFGGIVDYVHGAWFGKSDAEADGAQIDLMYIRKDAKIIVCEIKYNNDTPITRKVIGQVQEKVESFIEHNPRYRRHTFETALITAEPAPDKLAAEGFFTYLIDGKQLFTEPS